MKDRQISVAVAVLLMLRLPVRGLLLPGSAVRKDCPSNIPLTRGTLGCDSVIDVKLKMRAEKLSM